MSAVGFGWVVVRVDFDISAHVPLDRNLGMDRVAPNAATADESDAGRRSAWIASSCRHPKTCTTTDSRVAANSIVIQSPHQRERAALGAR
jgi:hypothetical protein